MKSTTVKKRQSAWLFKAFVALLVGLPALLEAQTQSQNYIKTTTYKVPTTLVPAPTAAQKVENITYFDGLGRPIQQIAGQQSNSGKDIITHIEYDAFGRQTKEYLPYASGQNNLEYLDGNTVKTNLITQYQNWYGDQNPYSEKQLEASPLNRVMQQAAPGNEWALNGNKTIKFDYQTNTATEVKLYTATATWNAALGLYEPVLNNATGNTYYTANQLYKSVTKDENWTTGNNNTTQEFKDKEGKVVLKRSFNSAVAHDTYYVYDQYGNLSFVLPPLVTNASITSQMAGLCYQYRYDYRNRLVEKKLPGKQWEFIVYDKLDRPVATGPAFSPFGEGTTGWMITKYDALNRPVYTGWQASTTVTTSGRLVLQNAQNGATVLNESKTTAGTIDGISVWYSNVVAPTGFKILSVNYYDDYNFPNGPTVFGTAYYNNSLKPKGLATGAWVRVCQGATDKKGETSYTLYDYKARAIQTKTVHYLGGYTQTDSNLDFVGKPISTETRHKRTVTDAEIRVNEVFTYSAQDRLLTHTHQINGGAIQLLANNSYDELGKLTSKKVGGAATGTGLQNVNYSYNIRGWLMGINDINSLSKAGDPMDLFSFRINYQKPVSATPLFNGNISETFWRTSSDNVLRKYSYSYDHLNRLLEGKYEKPQSTNPFPGSYDERLEYDKNGNILNLRRNGDLDSDSSFMYAQEMDVLGYAYKPDSNLLLSVTDDTANPKGFNDGNTQNDDFEYDNNGNMTVDKNKDIKNITYNHLNLPTKILFGNSNYITYIYTASGQKVNKVVNEAGVITTTDYINGFQYKTLPSGDGGLVFFPHAEGYVNVNKSYKLTESSLYNYVFNYTDHLGNIRMSYTQTPTGALSILEENHYYPFGLKHTNYNSDKRLYVRESVASKIKPVTPLFPLVYNYKYQGQERQDELGLNWDSFKWRNYDYAIGRFMSIDPLAEKYVYNGVYNFAENRVIDGRELEGLEWENFRTTGSNPGSLKQKTPSADAQRQHYSVTVANSKKSFSDFKSDFKENPQDFLTNSKATFNSPVDGEGNSSDFKIGSFIKINIDGPMNDGYVKVIGMGEKKDNLAATFGTMEGHIEKGKITFRLQENKDGSIKFSIDSKSEVDMGMAPEKFSREQQKQSWKEVLDNITKYLGGEETKREVKTIETKKKE
ncbi:Rhs family protein precursor [Flavobacterium branchiophilum FL-15]|uniref:Rhs family protein n=2 Tax=Flavobacterium branchiophilum TaxID=55197 RepID=G2Z290_FLABF|nr:DUF1990 family protein [Flavobacterium branchiophilum]CCB70045.1 Rhs family protein precursor [Flavobacterium branchiophilum FL-15]